MKLFAALALLAVSTLAQAMPAVGDTATFAGTVVSQQGQTIPFQTEVKLVSFDQSQQKFQQTSTTTSANIQPSVDTKWVSPQELLNDAGVQQVLINCAANGGVLEQVTVPAGAFNTCRITDQSSGAVYNVGPVPFGVVKATQAQPQLGMQLISFTMGH